MSLSFRPARPDSNGDQPPVIDATLRILTVCITALPNTRRSPSSGSPFTQKSVFRFLRCLSIGPDKHGSLVI